MMTKEQYEEAVKNPKLYPSKQECIDATFSIVEYYIKHTNINLVINGQQFNLANIIPNKPDINDEKNVFALFMLYNKIIGEPINQTLIRR
jgi:hypothetical protein